jgi:hypothetical protein
MQSRGETAERYRLEASKYNELARGTRSGFLSDLYGKTAARYAMMAEELERSADRCIAGTCGHDGF